MLAHILTVIGYIAATLLVQGLSHYKINAGFYAATGMHREPPIVALGMISMVIQGIILSLVYVRLVPGGSLTGGLLTALAFGGFLASYIALGLAGNFKVPNIPAWIGVEATAALLQFSLIGLIMWAAHRFTGAA